MAMTEKTEGIKYISHIKEDGEEQPVYDHLCGTAARAAEFAEVFHSARHAKQVGLFHDIGKYSRGFQNRIRFQGAKVDHSTAGAVELIGKADVIGALCVAGHHGGIPDCGTASDSADSTTLQGRIKRKAAGKLEDYSAYGCEITAEDLKPEETGVFAPDSDGLLRAYFYTKFLFSALTDADFLDTEMFMSGIDREYRYDSIAQLSDKLTRYTEKWGNPETELNRIRCDILEECRKKGSHEKGLFSLTVPTGGGKTTASLAFALEHAKRHAMQRVIYVIPYTSIIEQNVKVFQEILGKENVLAHYSEVVYDDDDGSSRKKLASENWDAPLVVTTSVQFFESLFSNKPSKCRKIHNIADSVIIFDEYQMIPVNHMLLCTEAIYHLIRFYGCTALLCTATQPGTERFFHDIVCHEIVRNPAELFEKLRRVSYEAMGKVSEENLGDFLNRENQVLCIVNTRKRAQKIYQLMDESGTYHLSTLMIPIHRRNVLTEIRERLKRGETCRVVSTSLIEAGVDVDFPILYREENGLDSIVQAAGRCNREGKRKAEDSRVYIFQFDDSDSGWSAQRINRDAMKETLGLGYRIGEPETTRRYFDMLFDLKGNDSLDGDHILKMIREGDKTGILPFRQISERFRMIGNDAKTIYVPYDADGSDLCRRLAEGERSRGLFRALGNYGISLYPDYYEKLQAQGVILEYDENAAVLSDLRYYSEQTGLMFPETEDGSGFFI